MCISNGSDSAAKSIAGGSKIDFEVSVTEPREKGRVRYLLVSGPVDQDILPTVEVLRVRRRRVRCFEEVVRMALLARGLLGVRRDEGMDEGLVLVFESFDQFERGSWIIMLPVVAVMS